MSKKDKALKTAEVPKLPKDAKKAAETAPKKIQGIGLRASQKVTKAIAEASAEELLGKVKEMVETVPAAELKPKHLQEVPLTVEAVHVSKSAQVAKKAPPLRSGTISGADVLEVINAKKQPPKPTFDFKSILKK